MRDTPFFAREYPLHLMLRTRGEAESRDRGREARGRDRAAEEE
jgi:hypothetical protein